MKEKKPEFTPDVARKMNKSTGSVHSAMKILNAKGILKTDHSGEITLLFQNSMNDEKHPV